MKEKRLKEDGEKREQKWKELSLQGKTRLAWREVVKNLGTINFALLSFFQEMLWTFNASETI